jgi:hypothetical protein
MSLPQLKHYQVNFHVLSPIHIGTGQEFDPFAYVIREKVMHLIDLVRWIDNYPEKDKLSQIMDSDNFANIRSFIAENFDNAENVLCSIPVDNPNLLNTYEKAIKERDPKNQVLISPMTRNPVTMQAILPGSSIKGSIRTAVANRFVKKTGVTSKDTGRGRHGFNEKIFGRINNDPMRWLKISDISLKKTGTAIVESKEYPKNPNKALTPKGHMEVALSLCHTRESYVYPLRFSMAPFDLHGAKVDPQFLIEALYDFYVPKYEQEYTKFYDSQRAEKTQTAIVPMNKTIAELKTNETIIRIGHFSHAECITLDGVRNPRTRLGRDRKPLPWGTTRTLANGIYPFGWAKLEFVDLDSKPRAEKKWPFSFAELEKYASQVKFEPKVEVTFPSAPTKTETAEKVSEKVDKAVEEIIVSAVEKILGELELIKSHDMGRIGTIIQKIDQLDTDAEKGRIAAAIKDKIGPKAFKKHKRKEYLSELIEKAGTDTE